MYLAAMRDSSLPSPDHSCNIARPVSLPCDDLMTQICTMSSPLSGSSGAYCSEPLILLFATRTPTQVQTSCFFRIFSLFFKFFLAFAFFTIYLMALPNEDRESPRFQSWDDRPHLRVTLGEISKQLFFCIYSCVCNNMASKI